MKSKNLPITYDRDPAKKNEELILINRNEII